MSTFCRSRNEEADCTRPPYPVAGVGQDDLCRVSCVLWLDHLRRHLALYQGLERHSDSVPDALAWHSWRELNEQPLQPGLSTPWMQNGYWVTAEAEPAIPNPAGPFAPDWLPYATGALAITCFVPWVGEAFSIRPSGKFLTLLQRVERTPTPTGIVFALDAIWILRGSLGRTRTRQSKSTDSQQRKQDPAHHPLTPSAR